MTSTRSLLGLIALGALAACGVETSSSGNAPPVDTSSTDPATTPFSQVVTIDQIAVYQGVKVSFLTEGQAVKANAPLVPKRPAVIRVGTTKPVKAKVNKLTAVLHIKAPGRPDLTLVRGPREVTVFDDSDLSTSFTWELEADQIAPGATMSVELSDPSGFDEAVLRYPDDGSDMSMNVGDLAPTFHVTIVPIQYNADGSGRTPQMDRQTLDGYRDALYRMYPVSEVQIAIRNTLAWPLEVTGDGQGWDELLSAVMKTRDDDVVTDDTYYVAVFNPADNLRDYCQNSGCIMGVAPAQNNISKNNVSLRTAMVVGYRNSQQAGTFAQELAHAMGRQHAPCGGPANIDKKFPYSDASIGTWGYDILSKDLIDPDERFDFMSYCSPVWVSDYTFANIYDQMVDVERTKRPNYGTPASQPMHTYHVSKDGSMSASVTLHGSPVLMDPVALRGTSGESLGSVRGSYHPLSNIGGGIFVSPTEIPAETLKRVRFTPEVAH